MDWEGIRTNASVRLIRDFRVIERLTLDLGLLTRRTGSLNAPTPMIELPNRELSSIGLSPQEI